MKKLLSIVLVAVMLFSFASVCVSAEEPAPTPELSYTKEVYVPISANHRLTSADGADFSVDVTIDDKNTVALDGSSVDYTVEILKIQAQKQGFERITYDENYVDENPDDESSINPFFEYMAFPEGQKRDPIEIYVTFKIDFTDADILGELNYTVSVKGFSSPPDLGDLGVIGGLIGGAADSLPIPTTESTTENLAEFPAIKSISPTFVPQKKVYLDSEMVELDGTQVAVTTTIGRSGTVTYGSSTSHMFTTLPDRSERIPEGTKAVVTYFFGHHLSTLPVVVSHDWSDGPVCITTDKYTDNKRGYHAIVCNGCGEARDAEEHNPEILLDEKGNPVVDKDGNPVQKWTSNDDASFVGNGTASSTCQDCGATLTKDVHNSAGFNTAFANYHFLLVIFEYINLILRIIGTSLG